MDHLRRSLNSVLIGCLIVALSGVPLDAAQNVKAVGATAIANVKAVGTAAKANVKNINGVDNTSSSYTPNTTHFAGDGQCWLERDAQLWASTGNAVYISFWLKPTAAGNLTARYLYSTSDDRVRFNLNTSNQVLFRFYDAAGTLLIQVSSTAAITSDDNTWSHVLLRLDRTVDDQFQIYVNGTSGATNTTFLSTAENANPIAFTSAETYLASEYGTGLNYGGCMADFWMSVGNTYAGITIGDFYVAGEPVNLGATGNGPDGTQPGVFLQGSGTGFTVNSGSRGDFVKKGTTALTTCSTAP